MPEQFGRYQLLARIGEGGMAEVFRARLQSPAGADKILVIKRILEPYSASPEFIQLFVNEAKIALPLTHGNVTSVFEFGEVAGQYYLAMEYIHGKNLEVVLDKVKGNADLIPVEVALFIAAEVARGLAYAHAFISPSGQRLEVVHLDVTPGNILVSYDGAVKLTDFGIAKARASQIAPGELRGKASYLAPEQVDHGAVDGRTDVFALGCVLYELLTKRRPFEGDSDEETLANVRRGQVPAPSVHRRELEVLDSLVMKALATNPAERYASAADFLGKLSEALHRYDPGYSTLQLGEWMRELFSWEIFEEQGSSSRELRDRLLFQLSKAKVDVDEGRDSTSELLALRTVSIPPPPPPIDFTARDRAQMVRRLVASGVAVVLVAGAGYAFWSFGPRADATAEAMSARPDAGPIPASMGRISVNSWPSAALYVDGKRIPGRTPILNQELPAGNHTLVFEQASGARKEMQIVVEAGQDRTVVVNLEK